LSGSRADNPLAQRSRVSGTSLGSFGHALGGFFADTAAAGLYDPLQGLLVFKMKVEPVKKMTGNLLKLSPIID
jgi:hypothetical protein